MLQLAAVFIGYALIAPAQPTISASNAWVKLPAANETTAAAFVTIQNPTMYDVYVVSAVTDAAGSVEFRRPDPTEPAKTETVKSFTAAAYDGVLMKPGGLHLQLIGLKSPLKEGDSVTLTLTTDGDLVLEVSAVVRRE